MMTKRYALKLCLLMIALTASSHLSFASQPGRDALQRFVPGEFGFFIPDHMGRVEDVAYGSTGKTVILIRDIHAHYDAQKSIARILEYLNSTYAIGNCYVEGFSGVMDMMPFTRFPFEKIRRNVCEEYLEIGKITGEEYLAVTAPGVMRIHGLEDRGLYEKNLEVFRNVLTSTGSVYEQVDSLKSRIIASAASSDERHMLAAWDACLSLTGETGEFLRALEKLGIVVSPDAQQYPQLDRFVRMLEIKNSIDINAFEREHAVILSILSAQMPPAVMHSFKLLIQQFQAGRLPEKTFFSVVTELIDDPSKEITAQRHPNFMQYMNFLSLSRSLHAGELNRELYEYGCAVLRDSLCSAQCADTFSAVHDLVSVQRVLRCELTPGEAAELCNIPESGLHALWDRCAAVAEDAENRISADEMNAALARCRSHYKLAFDRDKAMAQRIIDSASAPYSVCITGGFHTNGMKQILNERGYTTVVIVPTIRHSADTSTKYRSIMLNKLNAVEQLFARETSTLRQAALVWRGEQSVGMQFELLLRSLDELQQPDEVRPFISRMIVEAQRHAGQTEELLDAAALAYDPAGNLYIDFTPHNVTLKISPQHIGVSGYLELLTGSNRIPAGAKNDDLIWAQVALGISRPDAFIVTDPQQFALDVYQSVPSYDVKEYLSVLYNIKRATIHHRVQDDFVRMMVFEAALDYVGYKQPDEFTQEELADRYIEAEGFLKYIYKSDFHRGDFVRFLANYSKLNVRYNNYLMPLYVGAFNVIVNKPITSADLLRTNHTLFHNADTVVQHPWYGISRKRLMDDQLRQTMTPMPLRGHTTPAGKRQIRVLLIGAHENAGDKSPGKLLRMFMDAIPEGMWGEIVIESRDTVFPRTVYPFDPVSGAPKQPVEAFQFDENGIYHDTTRNIIYREIRPGDQQLDPLAPVFDPREQYDLVISSDLGVGQFTDVQAYENSLANLKKLLGERGVLIHGMGEMGFAQVIQRDGDTFREFDRSVPFYNMAALERRIDAIKSHISYPSSGDQMLVQKAVDLRNQFQTPSNPAFDIVVYAQFLTVFGESPLTVASFILQDVPESYIRTVFGDQADALIEARQDFSAVDSNDRWKNLFPAVVNLLPSDPSHWIVNESDEPARDRFRNTTDQMFQTLYDNGRYRFELGYHRHNAVMFVTKYSDEISSTRAFIISNISAGGSDVVYKSNIDVVTSMISAAELIDFADVPPAIPAITELETDGARRYSDHWNPQWVRPSPKHLRLAALFIDNAISVKREDLVLVDGMVYSPKMAQQFINHPLVSNNIKEGAKIFTSIYYLNPQLASVILRSMDTAYMPYMRLMLMQVLNEQVARLVQYSVRPQKTALPAATAPISDYILLQLLAPATTFSDEYRKNISEIFSYLPDETLVVLFDQLYSLVTANFQEGWAPALLAQVFHTELSKEKKKAVLSGLPVKQSKWLAAQQMKLDKPVFTITQLMSYVDSFLAMTESLEAVRASGTVDFDDPTPELDHIIHEYCLLRSIHDQPLAAEDTELIQSAVDDQKVMAMKTYNSALTTIFMDIFNGWTHPEDAAFALERIYERNPGLARTIVRSIATGKHFQMGSILFNMDHMMQQEIISAELQHLSERSLQRFMEIDGFAMFIIINFRHFINENELIPQDDIVQVLDNLTSEKLRNLFIHGYYFYTNNPGQAFMVNSFIAFMVDHLGDQAVWRLFADNSPQDIEVSNWIKQDILEINVADEQQIAELLESSSEYKRLRKETITLEHMPVHLEEMMYYLNDTREDVMKNQIGLFDTMITNLEKAADYFRNGFLYRGMISYGKAADTIDVLVHSSRQLSEDIPFRLAQYLSSKIDTVFAQYVVANTMSRVKSILPYDRDKVVGKLRMVPDTAEGVKLLFDQDFLDEGFAVVSQYPQNIASMAKPRAIIAEEGIGRDEHAAERAADWKIPYLILPRARKLLAGLVKDGEEDVWVTIELTGRSAQNIIRRATADEIQEEQVYRMQAAAQAPTADRKVEVIKPDLESAEIVALDSMTLADNVHAGNKTARLGHMKQAGLPVKDGFVVPFGFYHRFATESGLAGRIEKILSQPDFADRKADYLSSIREMVRNTPFSEEQEDMILKWFKEHIGQTPVIARSSTNAEDLPGYAGAGVYDSFPNLRNASELLTGIKKVYASVWTERAYENRQMNGIDHRDVYPSVLVQKMSYAKFSGVLNTGNEISGNKNEMTLSIDVGYGGGVDGLAAEFVYSRAEKQLIDEETDIPDDLAGTIVTDLTDSTFEQLDAIGLQVQTLFDTPQKIEFSFDDDGYWVNQSKDLQAFRPTDEQGSVIDADVANHRMTIVNHSGCYLACAKKLADHAEKYVASITIVKTSGYASAQPEVLLSADAKDVMEILELGLQQGDVIQIIARGTDANQAVSDLSTLVYNRFEQEPHPADMPLAINSVYLKGIAQLPAYTIPDPEFFIVHVSNFNGMHARPSAKMAETLKPFDADVKLQRIDYVEKDGLMQEVYGEPLNAKDILSALMMAATQGTRIKVTATGPQALDALRAIRELFENNLGDAPVVSQDISLDTVIYEGKLLTMDEKNAVDSMIAQLVDAVKRAPDGSVDQVVVDAFLGQTGFAGQADEFNPVDVNSAVFTHAQNAMFREPTTGQYITNVLAQKLPGVYIHVFTRPMDDAPVAGRLPVSNSVTAAGLAESSI